MPSLDILINAIPHRLDKLTALLDVLEPQIVPGVGVLIAYDNLEESWVSKCEALIQASTAPYSCHIDDDDSVAPDYVSSILEALESEPQYVGFNIRWTIDGVPQRPVYHSIQYSGWYDTPDALYRDICDKQPLRRDLALQARWEGGNGADRTWAAQLRGKITDEVYIDRELYYYQHSTADTYLSGREPFPVCPEPPQREFVRYV